MKCPGCAAEVDFGKDACPSCGVVYLKELERRAAARATRSAPARASSLSPYVLGAAAVLAGAALAWTRLTAAPLPQGALLAPELGLAFAPPSGWTLQALPDGLSFMQGPAGLRLSVRTGKLDPRRLAESIFNGAQVALGQAELSDLGGQAAVRLAVSGERAALPGAPQAVEWRGWVVAAERGGKVYAVAAWSESADFERREDELESFLADVRFTD